MNEALDISAEPLVSVVIPAYNAEKTLERAMASILQEKSVPLELIVVDDGSTDSTPQVIDQAARMDQRVRRITQPNGHVAAACNTGIRASRGKYVAFLEADDEWLPGKLEHQVHILESWPEVGAVFSNFVNHDEVTNVSELLFDQQKEVMEALPKKLIGDHDAIINGDLRPYLISSNFILRSSLVVRLEVLRSLGGSDENLKGDDDWDLWFRMGGVVRFACVDQPLGVRHKLSNSMSRPSPNWHKAVIRSRSKSLVAAKQTAELHQQIPRLEAQLLRLHRALIVSHNKRWEYRQAWEAFRGSMKYGCDPMSLLLVGLGVLGPIPFHVRRFVLAGVRFGRRPVVAPGARQAH